MKKVTRYWTENKDQYTNCLCYSEKKGLYLDNIPEGTNSSKGVAINNLIKLEPQEKVIAISSFERKTDAQYVIFITKKGQILQILLP